MIETEQTVLIDAAIEPVWDFARDMQCWAGIMPGYRECAIVDDNESRWTLKVGVGGLVRTVKVLVHVDQWDGPERVNFSYKLEGDPVSGGGAYIATRKGARQTEVTLRVRVEGGGPMAAMWEAMGKPLLPQFAKSFAEQLKAEIEKAVGVPQAAAAPSVLATTAAKLRNFWRMIVGTGRVL